MSVDIGVGFRFKNVSSFEEALVWMKKHRSQILTQTKQKFQKHLLEQALTHKLALSLSQSELPHLAMFEERFRASEYPKSLREAINKTTSNMSDLSEDLKTKSSIVVLPSKEGKPSLFGLFTSNSSIHSFFESHPEVENYNYHSGVSSGKGVSAKEWKKRGKEWEKVLQDEKTRRWSTFSANGVEIEVLNEIEVRLFNFVGMPHHLNDDWYDLKALAVNLALLSDLSVDPNLDQVDESQKGEAIFRYVWKLLSGRVQEFEDFKGLLVNWIKQQDLNQMYQELIKDIRID